MHSLDLRLEHGGVWTVPVDCEEINFASGTCVHELDEPRKTRGAVRDWWSTELADRAGLSQWCDLTEVQGSGLCGRESTLVWLIEAES